MASTPTTDLSPGTEPAGRPIRKAPSGWKRPVWRWLFGVLVLLASIAAATLLYSRHTPAPRYVTARVDRGDIDSTVTTTGNLNAVITVQVGSQVSGNIIALYADFNTKVKKGQLVAEIDPAPFKASVDQATATLNAAKAAVVTAQATLGEIAIRPGHAQANVASQKANLVKAQSAVELARVENDRRKIMVKTGSTSQEDADTAQANYEQAIAGVDAAQAADQRGSGFRRIGAEKRSKSRATNWIRRKPSWPQDQAILAQAQLNLDHTRILAPVDGTVESRNMDVGQTVAASFQAPVIFLIAQDLTKMQVDTNVDEADVGRSAWTNRRRSPWTLIPARSFHGRVAQIRQAPINVQNVITYDVVIEVSNPDLKLFPGMTANVTISTGHVANVLRVPESGAAIPPARTASKPRPSRDE